MRFSWKGFKKEFKKEWKEQKYGITGVITVLIGLALWASNDTNAVALSVFAMFFGGFLIGYQAGFIKGIIDEIKRDMRRRR